MKTRGQLFRHQAHLFSKLVTDGPDLRGDVFGKERPSPKRLLDFVEALLVCPTLDAVQAHIAQDREAAEVFRIDGNDAASACDIENAATVEEPPEHTTPLYLFASLLRRRALLAVEKYDEEWKPKQDYQ